jgi:hypothetical protein
LKRINKYCQLPFSSQNFYFAAKIENKKLGIVFGGLDKGSIDCFSTGNNSNLNSTENGKIVLSVSSELEHRAAVHVDVPGSIRLRIAKKVTQGTQHLIFDIDEIKDFWSQQKHSKEKETVKGNTPFPR